MMLGETPKLYKPRRVMNGTKEKYKLEYFESYRSSFQFQLIRILFQLSFRLH